jgi:hypothetical protein
MSKVAKLPLLDVCKALNEAGHPEISKALSAKAAPAIAASSVFCVPLRGRVDIAVKTPSGVFTLGEVPISPQYRSKKKWGDPSFSPSQVEQIFNVFLRAKARANNKQQQTQEAQPA